MSSIIRLKGMCCLVGKCDEQKICIFYTETENRLLLREVLSLAILPPCSRIRHLPHQGNCTKFSIYLVTISVPYFFSLLTSCTETALKTLRRWDSIPQGVNQSKMFRPAAKHKESQNLLLNQNYHNGSQSGELTQGIKWPERLWMSPPQGRAGWGFDQRGLMGGVSS